MTFHSLSMYTLALNHGSYTLGSVHLYKHLTTHTSSLLYLSASTHTNS